MTREPAPDPVEVRTHAAARPRRKLAIVTCMDVRVDPLQILGVAHGDAHVIRNAGGVVTDDVIRSLVLSQRKLGTREIILLHHTDCGLGGADEAAFRAELRAETGIVPSWSLETFDDPFDDVRQSMSRIRLDPFVGFDDQISGYVYDVDEDALLPVEPADSDGEAAT